MDNLQELAQADENSLVKEVHEFFGDYIPIDSDHYTLNLTEGLQLCRSPSQWKETENTLFHRATDVGSLSPLERSRWWPRVWR